MNHIKQIYLEYVVWTMIIHVLDYLYHYDWQYIIDDMFICLHEYIYYYDRQYNYDYYLLFIFSKID